MSNLIDSPSGPASVRITVDSSSYAATSAGLAGYALYTGVTVENTGARTVYLRRQCETESSPQAYAIRPAGSSTASAYLVGLACGLVGSTSSSPPPRPIAVLPGGRFSWRPYLNTIAPSGGLPIEQATGQFLLQIDILLNDHVGSQVVSADFLPADSSRTPVFTVRAP